MVKDHMQSWAGSSSPAWWHVLSLSSLVVPQKNKTFVILVRDRGGYWRILLSQAYTQRGTPMSQSSHRDWGKPRCRSSPSLHHILDVSSLFRLLLWQETTYINPAWSWNTFCFFRSITEHSIFPLKQNGFNNNKKDSTKKNPLAARLFPFTYKTHQGKKLLFDI